VQILRLNFQSEFFLRLTARARIRRFALVHVQFAAARTPEAEIWFLRAFEQQDFVALVEAVEQRGDFVGQKHSRKFQVSGFKFQVANSSADIPVGTVEI
jgi:hypothetical protein